jgi:hypothetical protein
MIVFVFAVTGAAMVLWAGERPDVIFLCGTKLYNAANTGVR